MLNPGGLRHTVVVRRLDTEDQQSKRCPFAQSRQHGGYSSQRMACGETSEKQRVFELMARNEQARSMSADRPAFLRYMGCEVAGRGELVLAAIRFPVCPPHTTYADSDAVIFL